MIADIDIWRTARLLMQQRDDAEFYAGQRADDELLAAGDPEGVGCGRGSVWRYAIWKQATRRGEAMPAPANPLSPEWFVYQFRVDGYPFYVGVGHRKRGTDRLRFIGTLLTPEKAAKLARKRLSDRVMAALLRSKHKDAIQYSCTRRRMTRPDAVALEDKTIARLIRAGFHLTNWQQNRYRHKDVNKAVRAILSKEMRAPVQR